MRDMIRVEIQPGIWVRMTREEAKAAGYDPDRPQGTKKATPTRKKKADHVQ